MATTITVQADVTANGLFIGMEANKTAMSKSNILRSGFVVDAGVAGSYSPQANTVSFPVWDFGTVVKAAVPTDGSALSAYGSATYKFVSETCANSIVSTRAMKSAILTGGGGMENYLTMLGQHVGKRLALDVEASLITKAVAAATTASQVNTTGANIDYDGIVESCTSYFGAYWNTGNTALILHPAVYAYLLKDADYKKAITHSKDDLSGGLLPQFMGMTLIISDLVPVDTGVYSNLIVTGNALQVYMNGDVRMEQVHLPGTDSNVYDAIYSYATHISGDYPTGVIVHSTTAA